MFDFENDVQPGDMVVYQSHPGSGASFPAMVLQKGGDSLVCGVYSYNGVEGKGSLKSGVRHVDDPIFLDPMRVSAMMEDGEGGCFDLHPNVVLLKDLLERVKFLESRPKAGVKPAAPVVEAEKPKGKGKPDPDLSFRLDESEKKVPPLTEEQKAERRRILQEAQ